jgi:hypothetical protein
MHWLKQKKRLGPLLALMFLWPVGAAAVEFSALMLSRQRDATVPGKIYVKNGKMRQEFNDPEGQTITILRGDKKLVWVLLPRNRTYMEVPLKPRWPGQFIQVPPDARTKRLVGNERLAGYDAEKYEVGVPGREGLEKETYWVVSRLGLPIKMAAPAREFSMEYQDIKEGGVADRLFEIPPGFEKVSKPYLD